MKRIISAFLVILMFLSLVPVLNLGLNASAFSVRKTDPPENSQYWYNASYNPFCPSYKKQCTWYAWGRAYEMLGTRPDLCINNAKKWYDYNINKGAYPYGSTPRAGSIMVTSSSTTGHVAFVEELYDNGQMLISEYNGSKHLAFNSEIISQLTAGQYRWNQQPVLGYIYLRCQEHTWDAGVITTAPTCKQDGSKRYTCTVCGETMDKTVPKGDNYHKYYKITKIVKATFKANGCLEGECTLCGKKKKVTVYSPKKIVMNPSVCTYNGKAQKPDVTVTDSKGKTVSSKYYSLSYKNNKNVGAATVTLKFFKIYSGTKEFSFKIRPAGTSISALTASSRSITVKWKKQSTQTTGYQIQYAADSKFSKNVQKVLIKDNHTISCNLSRLIPDKKYYVRIRTFKTVDGVNYPSSWSKGKSIKTLSNVLYVKDKETWQYASGRSIIHKYKYDNKGHLVEQTHRGDSGYEDSIAYQYDSKGNLIKEIDYSSNGSVDSITAYQYDSKGKMIKKTVAESQFKLISTFKYDEKGNLVQETVKEDDETVWYTKTYQYNSKGLLIKMEFVNREGRAEWSNYKYDSKGTLIEEEGYEGYSSYVKTFKYDRRGNLIQENYKSDNPAESYVVTYTYKSITL